MPSPPALVNGTPSAPDGLAVEERMGRAWQAMRRRATSGVLAASLSGRPAADSIEPGNLDVLDLLVRCDGRRMSDLAGAIEVDPSTVTRAVQRMEAAGLVRRVPAPTDGRVVLARVTPRGRQLHTAATTRRAALMRAALDDFAPDERRQLADLLERFVAALDRIATNAPDPSG